LWQALIAEMEAGFEDEAELDDNVLSGLACDDDFVVCHLPPHHLLPARSGISLNGHPPRETEAQEGTCSECLGGGCMFCMVSGQDGVDMSPVPEETELSVIKNLK